MKRSGFTLLEMLLATVLSVMLMVGVLTVVTSVAAPLHEHAQTRGQGPREFAEVVSDPVPIDAWLALLREDLQHARSVHWHGSGKLVMAGYMALDPKLREQTHRPAMVTYSVEKLGTTHWLVRRQMLLDVLTTANTQRDLVARGVTRFELRENGELPKRKPPPPPPIESQKDDPETPANSLPQITTTGDQPDAAGANKAAEAAEALALAKERIERSRRRVESRLAWQAKYGWVKLTEDGSDVGYKWWEHVDLSLPEDLVKAAGGDGGTQNATAVGIGGGDKTSREVEVEAAEQTFTSVWKLHYWTGVGESDPAREQLVAITQGAAR